MHVLNFFCDNAIYLMKIKMRKQFKLKVCNVEYKIHTCIFTIEWYAYFSIFYQMMVKECYLGIIQVLRLWEKTRCVVVFK